MAGKAERRNSDVQITAESGQVAIIDALRVRGAHDVVEERQGNRRLIRFKAADGRAFTVIAKSKKSGTWQASINDADTSWAREGVFWIFVDVEDPKRPLFHVAPDAWVRADMRKYHQEYLDRHGGERAVSKESTHHAIDVRRLRDWRGRWDLLGLA
jgi:hypothetical protein